MNCPHCAVELKISERRNIEVDYCPRCRGVWLDRGELDKLLESTAQESYRHSHDRRDYDDARRELNYQKRPYKKKSLLSEIFDL